MPSKFRPGTLPDHNWCTVHRLHLLGCEQYEQLLVRSGQRCEICGLPGIRNTRGKLHIDHYGHDWAVRGLLCNSCNRNLTAEVTERRPAWAAEYLANAWWIKECERLGVPTSMAPEPDFGTVIRDQFNVVWLREGDGLWRPQGRGRPGISSATWEWLYRRRGPHNTVPADLYGLSASERGLAWDYLISDSERAALQALLAECAETEVPLHATRRYGHLLAAYTTSRENT